MRLRAYPMTVPVNLNPDRKTLRQFGWLCLIVFGGVAIAGFSKSGLNSFTIAWAVAGLLGGACGWLPPRTAEMGVCDVDHPCVSNRLDSHKDPAGRDVLRRLHSDRDHSAVRRQGRPAAEKAP
ncbi:MAG UNVERIFIED_CONTAM: hypothetical protein LVR18_21865 [Planctomycetaceae bacterium]